MNTFTVDSGGSLTIVLLFILVYFVQVPMVPVPGIISRGLQTRGLHFTFGQNVESAELLIAMPFGHKFALV